MFRNYLTYNFALNFYCSCMELDPPTRKLDFLQRKKSLVESAEKVVHYFARSIQTQNREEELRLLSASLICLRDCERTICDIGFMPDDLEARFNVLHGRLEKLCGDSFDTLASAADRPWVLTKEASS